MRTTTIVACLLPLALLACAGPSDGGGKDAVDDSDTRVDSDEDTGVTWVDSGAGGGSSDDESILDEPIGKTAIDGTWTGTFLLTDVVPFANNRTCDGVATITIDGDAGRHVSAKLTCDTWQQPAAALNKYGKLTGYLFATLDPQDLSGFGVDAAFGAKNFQLWEFQSKRAAIDGDTLTLSVNGVTGIGQLRAGRILELTATREASP